VLKQFNPDNTFHLNLSHLNISNLDENFVNALNTFREVEILDLSHNNLSTVPLLCGLESLIELNLTGNPLLSPLELKNQILTEWGLPKLREIKMEVPSDENLTEIDGIY
jgi:hypothetical protein